MDLKNSDKSSIKIILLRVQRVHHLKEHTGNKWDKKRTMNKKKTKKTGMNKEKMKKMGRTRVTGARRTGANPKQKK
jgi:hypothetical protein